MGADAILLIAAALDLNHMRELEHCAHDLGMDVLVEVHNAEELTAALQLKTPLLGINNRNLKTFEVTLDTTIELLSSIGDDKIIVTESGILERADVLPPKLQKIQAPTAKLHKASLNGQSTTHTLPQTAMNWRHKAFLALLSLFLGMALLWISREPSHA